MRNSEFVIVGLRRKKYTPLSQMLRICQLPLKGGAQISLPPGGEGGTSKASDGKGESHRQIIICKKTYDTNTKKI